MLIIVSKKPFSFLLFIQLLVGPLVGFSSSESASSDKMIEVFEFCQWCLTRWRYEHQTFHQTSSNILIKCLTECLTGLSRPLLVIYLFNYDSSKFTLFIWHLTFSWVQLLSNKWQCLQYLEITKHPSFCCVLRCTFL